MSAFRLGLSDVSQALAQWHLIHMLAVYDLKQRYRRSYLGTLWVAIGMVVWVVTVTFVFRNIFNIPMREYLPHVVVGVVMWNFFSSSLTEASNVLVNNQEHIKSGPLPLSLFIFKSIWINVIVAIQNFLIAVIVVGAVRGLSVAGLALSVLGVVLLVVNVSWMALMVTVAATRFRDIPALLANALQILFYLTPIVWISSLAPERLRVVLDFNPLNLLLNCVREPLVLGAFPWQTAAVCLASAAAGWYLAVLLFGRCRRLLAYWIG